jgi:hypothetical protein
MRKVKAKPKQVENRAVMHVPGHDVPVPQLPSCDFCNDHTPAEWDFRMKRSAAGRSGVWAYGCTKHYHELRALPITGVGHAQRLHVESSA